MKLNTKIWVAVFMALALVSALMLFVHRVMTNGDNLNYLFIAGSVINGDLLEPFSWRFPVGYPFLIAVFAKIAGITIGTDPLSISSAGIYAIKLFGVLMAPLSVLAVWLWSRLITQDRTTALLITGLYATTRHLAPLYSIIGSEPYFLFLAWMSLWSWEKALTGSEHDSKRYLLIAVICTAVAILFRQIALAVPIAVLGAVVLTGRRRTWSKRLLPAGVAIMLLVGGILMIVLSDASHLNQLSGPDEAAVSGQWLLAEKCELLTANAYEYRMMIPIMLLPKTLGPDGLLSLLHSSILVIPIAVCIYLLCFAGLVRCLSGRRYGVVSSLYALVTVAVILIWPYRDGRFFIPLIPIFWFFVLSGLSWFIERVHLPKRVAKYCTVLPFVLFICWQIGMNSYAGIKNFSTMHALRNETAWHPDRYEITGELDFADHLACGMWISEHAGPKAVVYAEKAMLMGLSSARKTRYITANEASRVAAEQYVVVDSFPLTTGYGRAKLEFVQMLAENPRTDYKLVYAAKNGAKVYCRLRPETQNAPSVSTPR